MDTLEKGQDKIKKICDSLRIETLEPAKVEAQKIIAEAKEKALEIIEQAEEQAERMFAIARAEIEQERNVFQSSLVQAANQSVETLKQRIEKELFNHEFESMIKSETAKPTVIADLIKVVIEAIKKEGVEANLEVVIPQHVNPKEVAALLGDKVLNNLKDHELHVGHFAGGAKIRLVDKKMTLVITDQALRELMSSFVRKDFRKMIFKAE